MSSLEGRLRRLEERLVLLPSIEEYLEASNRERARALHELTQRLAPYGFDGGHIFTKADRRMLAEDTPERRERDGETVEAWYRAQGTVRGAATEGVTERLLARLAGCS